MNEAKVKEDKAEGWGGGVGGTQFSFLDSGKSRAKLTLISFDVLTCLFFFFFFLFVFLEVPRLGA